MAQNAFENNQPFKQPEQGINMLEVVRENARQQNNRHKIVVGFPTTVVKRPRSRSNDQTKTLAAFIAGHMPFKKSSEEKNNHLTAPLMMQSAAAAFAA